MWKIKPNGRKISYRSGASRRRGNLFHTNLTPTYVASELPGAPVINFAELNSGSASQFLPSPKASLIFGPWSNTEFYVQGGSSFHSNDVRGATQRVEPISPDFPFPTPTTPVRPLVQTKGAEVGVRTSPTRICKVRFRSGICTALPNCSRMATPEATVASDLAEQSLRRGMGELLHAVENLAFDFDLPTPRLSLPKSTRMTRHTQRGRWPISRARPRWQVGTRSRWAGDLSRHHSAELQRLLGEFAAALLWTAQSDF